MRSSFKFKTISYKGLYLLHIYDMPSDLIDKLEFLSSDEVLVASRGTWKFYPSDIFLQGTHDSNNSYTEVIFDADALELYVTALTECIKFIESQTCKPPYRNYGSR